MRQITVLSVILMLVSSFVIAQKSPQAASIDSISTTPIESILDNPGSFNNEVVNIKGQVTQYTEGSSKSTTNYVVIGDYGNPIKVNTTGARPNISQTYIIKGTVVIDPYTQLPYIIENARYSTAAEESSDELLYYILGGGFLLIAVLLIILLRKPKEKAYSYPSEPAARPQTQDSEFKSHFQDNTAADPVDDFKTIKITRSMDKTLKFIPGKLVITNGPDAGKEFRISGYPTPEGSVVSIGRENLNGERAYSHIQLKEQTVSKKQAEIIHKNSKLYIRNISNTNLTQVDGLELQPDETLELKEGSKILTGEVEFKYTI